MVDSNVNMLIFHLVEQRIERLLKLIHQCNKAINNFSLKNI